MLRPKKVVFKKRWALLRDSFSKLLSLTEFHATASTLLAYVTFSGGGWRLATVALTITLMDPPM